MRFFRNSPIVILILSLIAAPAWAGGWKFAYNLKPGQNWTATMQQQSTMNMMGQKNVTRNKLLMRYKVTKGKKSGWVGLTGKIRSDAAAEGGMDLGKMTFTADMHASGEIRNKKVTGSPAPPMGDMEGMSPEMKAMMVQSYQSMGDMWLESVFWFPEFPEEKLDIGDEFEMTQKMGSSTAAMGMNTVIKQVFTLEDVSDGLAYFSVRQRGVTKTDGIGAKTTTKTAGKGETIFDLKEGMWVEVVSQSQSTISMGGMAGMANMPGMPQGDQKMLHMTKIVVEKQ